MATIIAWILLSILTVAFFLYFRRSQATIFHLRENLLTEKKYVERLRELILNKPIDTSKDDQIAGLFKRIASISEEKDRNHKRVIELEDAIKKGTGVTLRKEVTEFKGMFEEQEMVQMKIALHFSIKERYTSLEDVKFFTALIDKINGFLQTVEKTKGA